MAIREVKQYFYTVLNQYLEEKQNLADLKDTLEAGLITEAQMQDAMEAVQDLEKNYYRLTYIMFLLDMPNKKGKQARYTRQYQSILEELKRLGADEASIKKENEDSLIHFKAALKNLKAQGEQ